MSRFAADPMWLVYLPPIMSPCVTSGEPGLLEHPAEAFAYYRRLVQDIDLHRSCLPLVEVDLGERDASG